MILASYCRLQNDGLRNGCRLEETASLVTTSCMRLPRKEEPVGKLHLKNGSFIKIGQRMLCHGTAATLIVPFVLQRIRILEEESNRWSQGARTIFAKKEFNQ